MIETMKITFTENELKKYENWTLSDFLMQKGIQLHLPCGGNGTCQKCSVLVHFQGEDTSTERNVLACRTKVRELLRICQNTGATSLCIIYETKSAAMTGETSFYKPEDTSGVLCSSIAEGARALSCSNGPSYNSSGKLYAAIDLGSTTIAIELFRGNGEVIHTWSAENPQRLYGNDVLSRIRAASESTITRSDLQRLAESKIQEGLAVLTKDSVINPRQLTPDKFLQGLCIAANTTMGHLLTGEDVSPLGHAPFSPGNIGLEEISSVFFLPSEDTPPVYRLPGISAFVGGDIVSGIYALDMDLSSHWTLLLDLGTNGEMALARRFGDVLTIYCTSTAAGPAFEAANISCGCAGVEGAIRHVTINERGRCIPSLISSEARTTTSAALPASYRIQQDLKKSMTRPLGLCGSGLISAVSSLYEKGLIDCKGTFVKDRHRKEGFPLWQLPGQHPLLLQQEDIRQLQMAKAAIRAGISCLLDTAGIREEDLHQVYLAGGFGKGLNPTDAANIGLLPRAILPITTAVGNSALAGAKKFLLERDKGRLHRIQACATEILLADTKDFQDLYLANMDLPLR